MWILIIEDEATLAKALRRGLTAEGYSVEVCHDGVSGYEFARRGNFDAIVLDLMLPGMNGYKILESLRQQGITTPVLVLTAKSGQYDQIDALDLGADDYLVKPFPFPVLLARLRALIRRATPGNPLQLTLDGLILHRMKRRAQVEDLDLRLTDLEFGILEALALHPEEPVSREEITGHAWTEGGGTPNSLDVRIAALRRKLENTGTRLAIETVRGTGYRLVRRRMTNSMDPRP